MRAGARSVATLVSRVSLSLRGFTGSSGSGPYRHTEETPSGKDEYVDTAACATSTAGVLLSLLSGRRTAKKASLRITYYSTLQSRKPDGKHDPTSL